MRLDCNSKSIASENSLISQGILGSDNGLPVFCGGKREQKGRGCEQPAHTLISSFLLTSHLAPPALPSGLPHCPRVNSFSSLFQPQEICGHFYLLSRSSSQFLFFPTGMCPLWFLYRHFCGISKCSQDAGCRPWSQIQPTVVFSLHWCGQLERGHLKQSHQGLKSSTIYFLGGWLWAHFLTPLDLHFLKEKNEDGDHTL